MKGASQANTPYDDVFRTLLTDCTALIIPVVNEVFGEHYPAEQRVEFRPNEHFLNQQDGQQRERITDSYFVIFGPEPMGYQIECQSSPDGSLVIRIFEYGVQIAVQEGELRDNEFTVKMPRSAVLYLRSRPSTPDRMKIRILTPGGEVSYNVPVLKVQNDTLEDIFGKGLLFLIPFYIFTHEARFREYERDAEKLGQLQKEYEIIRLRLDKLSQEGILLEYTEAALLDMTKKVLEHITRRHAKVREGVKSVMGGKVLDYPAKTFYHAGLAAGEARGEELARHSIMERLIADGFPPERAANIVGLAE